MLLDTSVLIDYFRKKDKASTLLHELALSDAVMKLSVITEYEIFVGATAEQHSYWNQMLEYMEVLPLTSREVRLAALLQGRLKRQRKQLALPDLFIATTALNADLPLATMNRKDFEKLPEIRLYQRA